MTLDLQAVEAYPSSFFAGNWHARRKVVDHPGRRLFDGTATVTSDVGPRSYLGKFVANRKGNHTEPPQHRHGVEPNRREGRDLFRGA